MVYGCNHNINKIVSVFTEHMLTLLIREDHKIKILLYIICIQLIARLHNLYTILYYYNNILSKAVAHSETLDYSFTLYSLRLYSYSMIQAESFC